MWAGGAMLLLLLDAVARLCAVFVSAYSEFESHHWCALMLWAPLIVYLEGYRGFHDRFAPALVIRSHVVAQRGPWWTVLLAPVVAVGLLWGSRRRLITSWTLVVGVCGLVLAMRSLPLAWRGVVDGGVALALAVGISSIVAWFFAVEHGVTPSGDPGLPKGVLATVVVPYAEESVAFSGDVACVQLPKA